MEGDIHNILTHFKLLMNTFVKMRFIIFSILLAALMNLPTEIAAQGLVSVTVHTKIESGTGSNKQIKIESVRYATFRSYKKAEDAKSRISDAIDKAQKTAMMGDDESIEEAIREASKKQEIVWEVSQPTGIFQTNAMKGNAILVLGGMGYGMNIVRVEGGGDVDITIRDDRMSIAQVDVYGKGTRLSFTDIPTIDTGNTARFNINYWIEKGKVNERNRLTIQPIVIECQSEDTVAYLQPLIYEGEEYHKLQDKRFAFDYNKNDSVARGYHPEMPLRDDREFEINENVSFHKPNKDASYRCVYPVILEDYHHVISVEGKENGSCNSIKPFKFLNLTTGVAELPLSSIFKEDAAARFDEYNQDILLTFETNSDELTKDSINMVELHKLSEELRSYGDKLFQVTIQGGASAEGSVEHNTKLAQQRANRALRMLSQYGLASDVSRTTLPPKVFTWAEVLAEVEKQGNEEVTQMVRSVIEGHKQNEVWGILKGMPFFESVIQPIMVRQRMMRCTYLVSRERVMEPTEAVQEYFAHKKQYISRDKSIKALSMGDYYNLFAMIKDSLELDTLTTLAYSQLVEQPRYETLPLAPYLANRMAVMNLRRGTADIKVLEPFINFERKNIPQKLAIDQYHDRWINFPEMLINQAMNYFIVESERSGKAKYILYDWLPQNDERVKKVQMLSTFQNMYLSYITGALTDPADIEKARESEAFVLGTSDENRAIIYTELRKFIGKTRKDVEPLVDKMSDDNAKKWYLKALLWVDDAGKEPKLSAANAVGNNGFKELSLEEEMRLQREDPEALDAYYKQLEENSKRQKEEAEKLKALNVDDVPYFLAYFQHSFDMEPEYKKLFYREGNISEDIRKKYKYRKKDIPAYRRKFEMIKAAEDAAKSMDETLPAQEEAQSAEGQSATEDNK